MKRSRAPFLIAAIVAGLSAGIASFVVHRATRNRTYNVVLITVDTLRPDRLGYAGHTRPTSPTIDQLAREGLVFPNSYSVSGWTLPSIATIMTGRYPRDHGATDFHWAVDLALPSLASALRSKGYDTRAFVSHIILTPTYGLSEGFHMYDASILDVGHPHNVSSGAQLTDLVIERTRDMTEPYFLWVHYFDPHFQYMPHPEWKAFGSTDIDRYDQEIAFTDSQISRLFAYLRKKKGLDTRTITVFTADHGEEFMDHGAKYHDTLYDEVLRSPLIVKAPFIEPGVNESVAQQIDVMPTIFAMLGVEADSTLPGRNLLDPSGRAGPVFLERDRPPQFNQRGVILGDYKLWMVERADTTRIPRSSLAVFTPPKNVFPGIYLFDLKNDPKEMRNIYAQDDAKAIELMVMIAEHFVMEKTGTREVRIDDKLREKLRSLGYLN
jgi:arylsulfatase A-like enzyme